MDDTYQRVKALMVKEFHLDPDQITPTTDLESLGVDSLGALEFIFELETEFGVTVAYEREVRGSTFQDVVDAVDAALTQQAPQASAV
jgi:acyl carrier protein